MRDVTFPRWQAGLAIVALLVIVLAPVDRAVVAAPPPPPQDNWAERGARAASIAMARPGTVSFSVVDANGRIVAGFDDTNKVSAASTIKAMILAAYLRLPDVAQRELTPQEQARMEAMITWSSNEDASRLLKAAGWGAMQEVALAAGMADGYAPDQESWGLTQITAASMARFFHALPALLPPAHREFALGLFGDIVPGQRWGLTDATPAGWAWHVKGGWLDDVVNQIGTFTRGSEEFTLVVTVEGKSGTGAAVTANPEEVPAVQTIELIARSLFGDGNIPNSEPPYCVAASAVQGSGAAWAVTSTWADPPDCPPTKDEVAA